eukprot:68238-Chlamydomonas_euryale.AAC.1
MTALRAPGFGGVAVARSESESELQGADPRIRREEGRCARSERLIRVPGPHEEGPDGALEGSCLSS